MWTTGGLGQSQSNVNVGNTGDRLANVYWRQHGLPAVILYAEMEYDNAKVYFMRYCKWVANTLIPAYFDNNLQPSRKDSSRCCTTSTLAQHIGQHMKKSDRNIHSTRIGRIFEPPQPILVDPMQEAFVKESQHFQLAHSGYLIFGAGKV
jgi:hypothetical protein